MTDPALGGDHPMHRRLVDEAEQLRTALENALDENARLIDDRDRLLGRVTQLSRELQALHEQERAPAAPVAPAAPATLPSPAEEELRVAFEELQVLTEELEVSNTSLHEANHELDRKVEARTRQLRDTNAALGAAEGALRSIADLVPDILWRTDASGVIDWCNQRWRAYLPDPAAAGGAGGWLDAVRPEQRTAAAEAWQTALRDGLRFEGAYRLRGADTGDRWFLLRAEPTRDEGGAIVAWFGAGADIEEQQRSREALEQSEHRFRTLAEGMAQLAWRASDDGHWTWASPQWTAYTGLSDGESAALGWLAAFAPEDRAPAMAAWAEARETGRLEIEGRILHAATGEYRHFRTLALPVPAAPGRPREWLGTCTDIDDLRRLQAQQAVLVGELQHRTRNLIGVVRAVTLRTLGDATSLAEFRDRIDDRLQALGRVQGLLSRREAGVRVAFDVLLREELSAHVTLDEEGQGAQVETRGPPGIRLRSSAVQTLALALHELATNATKYGALSQADGRLVVQWSAERSESGQSRLRVEWQEHGVADIPTADAAARGGGYGRELIERALPYQLGARTSYGFAADGVRCTIELDVPPEEGPRRSAETPRAVGP